jgi:hypothetical protein
LSPLPSSSYSPSSYSASYPGSSQQQIPVVYRSAPFRREAEREKNDFRDLEAASSSSSPSLTPRILFVDDGGGVRARLAAALFASALAEANGNRAPPSFPPLRIEFAAASVGPPARGPPDEAVVAAAHRAGVSAFFAARGGGGAALAAAASAASSPSSPPPASESPIEEADLVRADLCLVCDRYDAEDLLRDAAALDGASPGAFYSARVRKLSAFAPAAAEWCAAARERGRGRGGGGARRGGGRSGGSGGGSGGGSAAPLFLDPNGDIDDPLYGTSSSSPYPSFSSSLSSNDGDGDLDGDLDGDGDSDGDEESELSDALDATVAQLRLATRGLLQFLLKLEERRHLFGGTTGRGNREQLSAAAAAAAAAKRKGAAPPLSTERQPLLSLHSSLRQAILCPLLSPEAERGGRGPAAAVAILQVKAAGWRPVWQEESAEEDSSSSSSEEDEGSSGAKRAARKKATSPSALSASSTTTLYTLKASKDGGRQIITRKMSVEHGHWSSVENVDAALARFIERKRRKRTKFSSSSVSAPPAPASFPTQAELRAAGEASMAKAANSAGGLAAAAARLGLRPTNRTRGWWRDFDAVAEELREVARAVAEGEDGQQQQQQQHLVLSMPAQAQLRAAGKGALVHAIRRHGGAEEVARRAGLRCDGRQGVRRGGGAAEGEEEGRGAAGRGGVAERWNQRERE